MAMGDADVVSCNHGCPHSARCRPGEDQAAKRTGARAGERTTVTAQMDPSLARRGQVREHKPLRCGEPRRTPRNTEFVATASVHGGGGDCSLPSSGVAGVTRLNRKLSLLEDRTCYFGEIMVWTYSGH